MAQANTIGRVTSDLELKFSAKKVPYLRFTIAERVGYRDSAHTQYIQVWAWDSMAKRLVDSGVKKGSLLRVSGSLELEEYTRQDGVTRDKRLKLRLKDWGLAPAAQRQEGTPRPAKGSFSTRNHQRGPGIPAGVNTPAQMKRRCTSSEQTALAPFPDKLSGNCVSLRCSSSPNQTRLRWALIWPWGRNHSGCRYSVFFCFPTILERWLFL